MRLTPIAEGLPSTVPFVGPETLARRAGVELPVRIGANESPFGPSPKVLRAMAEALGDVWTYGEPENHELKQALAAFHGVGPENICVGEGIDGLLGNLVRLLVRPGVHVVTSDGAYPTFNYHVAGFGGTLTKVPYRNDHEDPDALAAAANETDAALVYLSNPDNPMGTWLPAARVEALADALPPGTVLCLDEAYSQTAPEDAIPPMLPLRSNVIRMRTFSKAYGLAGQRVGYAIAEAPLAQAFDKVRNHFGVNKLGQVAALAALEDQAYLRAVLGRIEEAKERIAAIVRTNGLAPIPSGTNFVTFDCGRDAGFATAVVEGLGRRGIFVRKPMAPGLDRCVRVSAGLPAHLDALEAALPAVLDEAARAA